MRPYSSTTEFLTPDSPHANLHYVSRHHRPHPRGCPRRYQISGKQSHRLRDMPDHHIQRENEMPRIAVLT